MYCTVLSIQDGIANLLADNMVDLSTAAELPTQISIHSGVRGNLERIDNWVI